MSVIRFEPFRDPFREFDRLMSMAASGTRAPLGMPMDVYRGQDGAYHVEADLPGVDADKIEVTVEHSVLTIRAERAPHHGEGDQVPGVDKHPIQGPACLRSAAGECAASGAPHRRGSGRCRGISRWPGRRVPS